MTLCDLAAALSGCATFAALVATEIIDSWRNYAECDRRLFWCKRCGEFYLRQRRVDVCECPKCGENNHKLMF
jgi:Zn finger protein HypA/HybF involved in hydrogenase expression